MCRWQTSPASRAMPGSRTVLAKTRRVDAGSRSVRDHGRRPMVRRCRSCRWYLRMTRFRWTQAKVWPGSEPQCPSSRFLKCSGRSGSLSSFLFIIPIRRGEQSVDRFSLPFWLVSSRQALQSKKASERQPQTWRSQSGSRRTASRT